MFKKHYVYNKKKKHSRMILNYSLQLFDTELRNSEFFLRKSYYKNISKILIFAEFLMLFENNLFDHCKALTIDFFPQNRKNSEKGGCKFFIKRYP